jgi:putative glutamine amidotransferase
LSVPTSHHQCVGKLGGDLHLAAQSDDGLPEAIETGDGRFVIGVQWHPERDFDKNKVLFDEFLKHASEYMAAHAANAAG